MVRRKGRYLPALRFEILTPFYDPLVRWTTREGSFKRRLLEGARVPAGGRVLDVGCGTGTLLLELLGRQPSVRAAGLDGDGRILLIARSKVREAGRRPALVRAFSTAVPFADGSFDRVLSTLMLHHLDREGKVRTAAEIYRVLRPGGELHVADWGRPHNGLMWVLSWSVRLGDGLARTADNVRGRLPALFLEAGFREVVQGDRFATAFGTLQLYRARKP